MIRVDYSNQIERLTDRLIERLAASDAGGAFVSVVRAASNRGPKPAHRDLSQARDVGGLGIAAGLEFLVPEKFLTRLARRRSRTLACSIGTACSLALDVLDDASGDSSSLPVPVRAYLDASGGDEDARQVRRYQLAARLAGTWRTYADWRPELLETWADGRTEDLPDLHAETEAWQRVSGAKLYVLVGRWSVPGSPGGSTGATVELLEALAKSGFELPRKVHFFGFSYAWAGHARRHRPSTRRRMRCRRRRRPQLQSQSGKAVPGCSWCPLPATRRSLAPGFRLHYSRWAARGSPRANIHYYSHRTNEINHVDQESRLVATGDGRADKARAGLDLRAIQSAPGQATGPVFRNRLSCRGRPGLVQPDSGPAARRCGRAEPEFRKLFRLVPDLIVSPGRTEAGG